MSLHSGTAALIGQPNAGKSTLLNRLLGSKLAIVSSKPQTTRHRIAGIYSDDRVRIRLVDTPGIHEPWTELNREMVSRAMASLADCDAVIWLCDSSVAGARRRAGEPLFDPTDLNIAAALAACGRPVVFAANKADVADPVAVAELESRAAEAVALAGSAAISAVNGQGVDRLLQLVTGALPEVSELEPTESWTELSERFLAAEIVREKVFHLTEQEIPYTTHVEVVQFDESVRETEKIVRILADVIVERSSQKAIVIGKGGEMLKRIGTLARKELQQLLDCRVYLELFVKVERDWTRTQAGLRRAGYR